MPNKMLIDSSHQEETRVVVVHGNRIEEFDFESQDKKQLKGNIYLARVTRVEPSLQAAFVEYGGNRHGFLAFSEIHPDYYQIPVADRQALLKAEADAAADEAEEEENEERGRGRRRRRSRGRGRNGDEGTSEAGAEGHGQEGEAVDEEPSVAERETTDEAVTAIAAAGDETAGEEPGDNGSGSMAAAIDADVVSEAYEDRVSHTDSADAAGDVTDVGASSDDGSGEDGEIESLGAGDAIEEAQARRRPVRRQYKIQEVIKRRQILLVQVVKEERGNKGAALTTYLSLAGRYSVLMPNTARGGGISRKITNAQDRKRLKEVVQDLEVPQGMGVILRTAGESRTKAEIKRDYEYLMRLWENVRTLTLQSTAPALVYEEGSLIKRSVRDLYNKDIDEILVSGEDGYREAKDFMRMLMPSHAKVVQPYRENSPIFVKHGVEAQLDRMLQPQVTLKSGGYIIINQTEALVAIDVNSGRSTREHSIEETALHTNLEAAEEVARQLRLRDLAGLIVIDFIDMEESRNNRTVEKRLKDHLKNDRARIQLGRISHFGLMEMSRQRIRASVLESTTKPCPHCGGTGHVRSDSSIALFVVRAIEEFLLKDNRSHISVRTPNATAMYVLNHKRASLTEMEARFGVSITVEVDETVGSQHYVIVRGAAVEKPIVPAPHAAILPPEPEDEPDLVAEVEEDEDEDEAPATETRPAQDGERNGRRRRRRRKRGGRDRDRPGQTESASTSDDDDAAAGDDEPESGDEGDETTGVAAEAQDAHAADDRKKRRRGRRGGKRHRGDGETVADEAAADDSTQDAAAETAAPGEPSEIPLPEAVTMPVETVEVVATDEAEPEAPKKGRRTATRRKAAAPLAEDAPEAEAKPRKRPSRRKASPAATEAADTAPVEAAAPSEPIAAIPARIAPPEPEAETAPRPEAPVAEVEEPVAAIEVADAKPAGANGDQPTEDTEGEDAPASEADAASAEPDRPKKSGWWQRRGFF